MNSFMQRRVDIPDFNSNHHGSKKAKDSEEGCKEGNKEAQGSKEARIVLDCLSADAKRKIPREWDFSFLDRNAIPWYSAISCSISPLSSRRINPRPF